MIFSQPCLFLTKNSTIWYKHWWILFISSKTRILDQNNFLKTDTVCFHCVYIVYSITLLGFSFPYLLFTETNSSWLIYESIKSLEIKISAVPNLIFC